MQISSLRTFFASIAVFSIILLMYSSPYLPKFIYFNQKLDTNKTILYWTPLFNHKDMLLGLGSKIFQHCEYTNCYATHNKAFMPVQDFSAVVFHGRQYYQMKDFHVPQNRSEQQIYIFLNMESPIYTYIDFMKNLPNFFNWTMTYRLDSDVVRPYGYYEERDIDQHYEVPSIESIVARPKKIAWFVSHCSTESRREAFVAQLKNFIPVDVYGKCGNLSCRDKKPGDCDRMVERNYKFYLSLENSICDDYVTEKLFKFLMLNIVPIVYGGANYSAIAPPHSFIDARDFKDVEALANYLKFLDSSPHEYLKYFEWKRRFFVSRGAKHTLCDLCKKLNEPLVHKSYDIVEWWYGPDGNRCPKFDPERVIESLAHNPLSSR